MEYKKHSICGQGVGWDIIKNMTRYLIIILVIATGLALIVVLFPLFSSRGKPAPSPLPVLTAPSASPFTSPKGTLSTQDQINLQAQADQDFAKRSKQIKEAYPWLDKLPIQSQKYYVYFDVNEKQFIAKLYPSSSSSTSVDQQVENMQNEIKAKLQELIPDYTKYNIRWDIKVE